MTGKATWKTMIARHPEMAQVRKDFARARFFLRKGIHAIDGVDLDRPLIDGSSGRALLRPTLDLLKDAIRQLDRVLEKTP